MKVLLVNKFHFQKGGAETYYFTIAKALMNAGHEVFYFSMRHEKNISCREEKYFVSNKEYNEKTSFIKKIRAFSSFAYSKEAYNNISNLIDDIKPDIAILNNIHRQLTTSIIDALYEKHVKIIWIVHDLILLCPNYQMLNGKGKICEKCCNGKFFNCVSNKCVKNSYIKSFLGYYEAKSNKKRKIINKINFFITPSLFYRNKLIQYGFEEQKVIYLPNPLPLDYKYELFDDCENYYLYFGRLSREKGLFTLIDASIESNIDLKIVGDGPLKKQIEQYLKERKATNIKVLGFKYGDELEQIIKKAKFIILPSEWYENGPYSAMEAMGKGKPLIVSSFGGLPEMVKNGENGFVFKEKTELIKILLITKNIKKEEYSEMSLHSLKKAYELFEPNHYIHKLFKVINGD